jgi:hypothetical protein
LTLLSAAVPQHTRLDVIILKQPQKKSVVKTTELFQPEVIGITSFKSLGW